MGWLPLPVCTNSLLPCARAAPKRDTPAGQTLYKYIYAQPCALLLFLCVYKRSRGEWYRDSVEIYKTKEKQIKTQCWLWWETSGGRGRGSLLHFGMLWARPRGPARLLAFASSSYPSGGYSSLMLLLLIRISTASLHANLEAHTLDALSECAHQRTILYSLSGCVYICAPREDSRAQRALPRLITTLSSACDTSHVFSPVLYIPSNARDYPLLSILSLDEPFLFIYCFNFYVSCLLYFYIISKVRENFSHKWFGYDYLRELCNRFYTYYIGCHIKCLKFITSY